MKQDNRMKMTYLQDVVCRLSFGLYLRPFVLGCYFVGILAVCKVVNVSQGRSKRQIL